MKIGHAAMHALSVVLYMKKIKRNIIIVMMRKIVMKRSQIPGLNVKAVAGGS